MSKYISIEKERIGLSDRKVLPLSDGNFSFLERQDEDVDRGGGASRAAVSQHEAWGRRPLRCLIIVIVFSQYIITYNSIVNIFISFSDVIYAY